MDGNTLDSLEKYLSTVQHSRRVLKIIGYDVFDKHYRPNNLSLLAYTTCFTFSVCWAYTISTQLNNPTELLKCACVFGPPAQSALKLLTLHFFKHELYTLHRATIDFYRKCPPDLCVQLALWTRRSELAVKFIFVLYCMTGVFFVIGPLIIYVVYGEKMLVIPVHIPGVDVEELKGFLYTTAYEIFCSFMAVLGLLSVDLVFVILCISGVIELELIMAMCKRLNVTIQATKKSTDGSKIHQRVTATLRDTVITTQQADKYESDCNEIENL